MGPKKPLCPRTLRCIARRLRARRSDIDKRQRLRVQQGIKRNPYSDGRAAECELQADNLLTEARAIEAKGRKR